MDELSEGLRELKESMTGPTQVSEGPAEEPDVSTPSDDDVEMAPSVSGETQDPPVDTISSTVEVGASDLVTPDEASGSQPGPAPPFVPPATAPHPEGPAALDLATTAVAAEGRDTGVPGDWPLPQDLDPQMDFISLPLADFELQIFPVEDENDHEEGQRTLARVLANLMSAGYEAEPWRVQIAASVWGRRTYAGGDVNSVRLAIERAPVAEIIACIPQTDTEALDQLKEDAEQILKAEGAEETEGFPSGLIPVATASLIALLIPVLISRRSKEE